MGGFADVKLFLSMEDEVRDEEEDVPATMVEGGRKHSNLKIRIPHTAPSDRKLIQSNRVATESLRQRKHTSIIIFTYLYIYNLYLRPSLSFVEITILKILLKSQLKTNVTVIL